MYDKLKSVVSGFMANRNYNWEQVRENTKDLKLILELNIQREVSDDEMNKFVNDEVARGYKLLMVENSEYPIIEHEKRYIIDADKCIIC